VNLRHRDAAGSEHVNEASDTVEVGIDLTGNALANVDIELVVDTGGQGQV
jgi:hypothetical protein